jgi:hypothetical protein
MEQQNADWRQVINLNEPIKLHYGFKKFWEIFLCGSFSDRIQLNRHFRGVPYDQYSMRETFTELRRG